MSPVEWITDIAKAADELGYSILSIAPRQVRLVSTRGGVEIMLESVFLSGDLIRSALNRVDVREERIPEFTTYR